MCIVLPRLALVLSLLLEALMAADLFSAGAGHYMAAGVSVGVAVLSLFGLLESSAPVAARPVTAAAAAPVAAAEPQEPVIPRREVDEIVTDLNGTQRARARHCCCCACVCVFPRLLSRLMRPHRQDMWSAYRRIWIAWRAARSRWAPTGASAASAAIAPSTRCCCRAGTATAPCAQSRRASARSAAWPSTGARRSSSEQNETNKMELSLSLFWIKELACIIHRCSRSS